MQALPFKRCCSNLDNLLWIVYVFDILHNIMCDITCVIVPCLLTLANRNDPIYVTSLKVAKASTIRFTVAGVITGIITLTFANGNTALMSHI